jgi:uncharacterized protein YegL
MKKDLTEIVVVLDESGSMGYVVRDTIGGINNFVDIQKNLPGEAKFSLVKFSTISQVIYDGVTLDKFEPLTTKTYYPGGGTALLDAFGKTINLVGARLDKLSEDEKPEKVLFVVITDGEENSSLEFTLDKVKRMVEHQRDVYKWEFLFLGANIDAFSAGESMGTASNVNFTVSDIGSTLSKTALYSAKYRSSNSQTTLDYMLSDEEVNKQLNDLTKK